jgi:high affinity Mn2+ porin
MLRQTIGFGGEREDIEGGLLQIAQKVDVNRLTITLGRFAVFDQFDNNAYAHDSRGQFMNWALLDAGAFDYAADAYGYTQGLSLELNQKHWALRWGAFLTPKVSNGIDMDWNIFTHWQQVLELETRYTLGGHPGKARFLSWLMSANAGSYAETLANPALHEDITLTRRSRLSHGFVINLEQEITSDLGAFARLGWRDGRTEIWAFTDIDRSLSTGLSLKGTSWGRAKDTAGLAWVLDGLSQQHRDYIASGGLGPLIGDGRLNYGLESVIETYYDFLVAKGVHLALDYQLVVNPAYNRDRGPVNVLSVRAHWEW